MKKSIVYIILACAVLLAGCADNTPPSSQTPVEASDAGNDSAIIDPSPDPTTDNRNEDQTKLEMSIDDYYQIISRLEENIEETLGTLRSKEAEVSGFSADGGHVVGWYDDTDRLVFMKIEQYEWTKVKPYADIDRVGFRNTIDCYFDENDIIYVTSTRHDFGSYGSIGAVNRTELMLNTDGMYRVDRGVNALIETSENTDLLIIASIEGLSDAEWNSAGAYGIIKVSSPVGVTMMEVCSYEAPYHSYRTSIYWKAMTNHVIVETGFYDVLVIFEDGTSYAKWVEVKEFAGATVLESKSPEFYIEDLGFPNMKNHDYVMLTESSLVSFYNVWGSPPIVYSTNRGEKFMNLPNLNIKSAVRTGDGIIAIIGYIGDHRSSLDYKIAIYDVANDTAEVRDYNGRVDAVYGAGGDLYVVSGNDLISVAGSDKVNMKGIAYSRGDGAPLISVGSAMLAVVDGNNYDLTGEGEIKEAYLNVYARKGNKLELVMQADLLYSNAIACIALSPDEKKVYVLDSEELIVYDIESKEALFNAAIDNGNRPLWVDNEHIVFMKDDQYGLIHIADIKAGDTYSVNHYEEEGWRILNFQYVEDGYLYFSAIHEDEKRAFRVMLDIIGLDS